MQKRYKQEKKKTAARALAAAFWLLLWQLAAVLLDNSILLTGPFEMLRTLGRLFLEAEFWLSIGNSLLRIGGGFFLAAFLGVLLGSLSFRSRGLSAFLEPPVALMKTIPVASFVILAIIWLGGTENLSMFVSFVVVLPMVYLNTLSGLSAADEKLLEMAQVFQAGRLKVWRYIYVPALLPYLYSCFRTALGMAWKSGVAAELIGQPRHTIGGNLYEAKIFLDTPSLFAWTFTIIAASMLFERTVLFLLGRFQRKG